MWAALKFRQFWSATRSWVSPSQQPASHGRGRCQQSYKFLQMQSASNPFQLSALARELRPSQPHALKRRRPALIAGLLLATPVRLRMRPARRIRIRSSSLALELCPSRPRTLNYRLAAPIRPCTNVTCERSVFSKFGSTRSFSRSLSPGSLGYDVTNVITL
jgi:hypothetical protein